MNIVTVFVFVCLATAEMERGFTERFYWYVYIYIRVQRRSIRADIGLYSSGNEMFGLRENIMEG